jgi:hypothetical protein
VKARKRKRRGKEYVTELRICLSIELHKELRNAENDWLLFRFEANRTERTDNGRLRGRLESGWQ